jgi:hypothetical protein
MYSLYTSPINIEEVPPKFFFFLATSQFDWPVNQKKRKKVWRLLKIKGSILKYIVPPLWPTYIVERRTTFAKSIWN